MNTLSKQDYEYLAEVLRKNSGLLLGEDKSYLLESRLGEICAEYQVPNVTALIARLRETGCTKMIRKINEAMTTNESLFFRDQIPFQFFIESALPEILKRNQASRKIRIWSGACSTGQEPYSLMMAMMEAGVYQSLKAQGWDIQILATDYASHVLERARNGVYSEYESSRGLSSELREKYFEKVETGWRIRESIRGGVDFKVINLLEPFSFEPFDVVFLRNVLIYFDLEDKKTVLDSVARVTSDQGYLFLGAAETALGYSNSWGRVDGARTAVFSRLAKVLSKVA